jgi:hypothetical protein
MLKPAVNNSPKQFKLQKKISKTLSLSCENKSTRNINPNQKTSWKSTIHMATLQFSPIAMSKSHSPSLGKTSGNH